MSICSHIDLTPRKSEYHDILRMSTFPLNISTLHAKSGCTTRPIKVLRANGNQFLSTSRSAYE